MIRGEGDADVAGDVESEDSDDNSDLFKEKKYGKTKAKIELCLKTDNQGGSFIQSCSLRL